MAKTRRYVNASLAESEARGLGTGTGKSTAAKAAECGTHLLGAPASLPEGRFNLAAREPARERFTHEADQLITRSHGLPPMQAPLSSRLPDAHHQPLESSEHGVPPLVLTDEAPAVLAEPSTQSRIRRQQPERSVNSSRLA